MATLPVGILSPDLPFMLCQALIWSSCCCSLRHNCYWLFSTNILGIGVFLWVSLIKDNTLHIELFKGTVRWVTQEQWSGMDGTFLKSSSLSLFPPVAASLSIFYNYLGCKAVSFQGYYRAMERWRESYNIKVTRPQTTVLAKVCQLFLNKHYLDCCKPFFSELEFWKS